MSTMHDPRTPGQLAERALTIPLHGFSAEGSCYCGSASCRAAGKHPKPHGTFDPSAGYGILTGAEGTKGSGVFVLDTDERPGISGLDGFAQLCAMHGEGLPSTLIVATGGKVIQGQLRPGYHFYFRHPGFPILSSTSKLAQCVDIKGDPDKGFSFVVGPGSPHINGSYRVINDATIADAPGWLLDWPGLRKTQAADPSAMEGDNPFAFAPAPVDTTTPEGQRRIASYVAECRGETGTLAPAMQGERGSDRMYAAVARGLLYWLLPYETVWACIMEHYNPRCQPAWSDQELAHKIKSVLTKNREITPGPAPDDWGSSLARVALVGNATAGNDGEIIGPRAHNPSHRYAMALGSVIANGKLATRSASVITYQLKRHPDWIGVLQWDEFSEGIRAVNPPIALDAETGELTESDVTAIRIWFEVATDTTVSNDTLRCCIESVARTCRVHVVRDYLKGLPPGDPNLLDTLADLWFGASSELDREILKRFLVAAVRRILNPGEQVDTMLVLFGPQGHKKSQWIRALFGAQYVSTQMPDLGRGADASGAIATVWGQEFPELDKLLRVDQTTAKDFLSRVVDKYRPAYGRHFITKPRQVVFIGTTNEREFLRDPTGERRYWIIEVLNKIDPELIASMRDQVWAAALALALRGNVKHYFETGDEWDRLLKERHESYAMGDAWTEIVTDYCAGRQVVDPNDIFRDVIAKGETSWLLKLDPKVHARISGILKRLGACKADRGSLWLLPAQVRAREPSKAEQARRGMAGRVLTLVQGGGAS